MTLAAVLYIGEAVITEATLQRHHRGQGEIRIPDNAVVTPTGWDFVRRPRLPLPRGQVPAGASGDVASETALIQTGTCAEPDACYGCAGGEEFGAGDVEPASCTECPVQKLIDRGEPNCGCSGCNRHTARERAASAAGGTDHLVQQITAQILERLGA